MQINHSHKKLLKWQVHLTSETLLTLVLCAAHNSIGDAAGFLGLVGSCLAHSHTLRVQGYVGCEEVKLT